MLISSTNDYDDDDYDNPAASGRIGGVAGTSIVGATSIACTSSRKTFSEALLATVSIYHNTKSIDNLGPSLT